jgi:hypothetical protein
VHRHGHPIHGQRELSSRDRAHHIDIRLQLRADQRDLERCRAVLIADQPVGGNM